ncbi:MAG: hypothetical protein JRN15_19505, partial [Nitrososphaerota archaeon]|nr:hypothetical protein [Nitrososphaerota archaeon]
CFGQLDAILAHDTIDRLKQIQAPTRKITVACKCTFPLIEIGSIEVLSSRGIAFMLIGSFTPNIYGLVDGFSLKRKYGAAVHTSYHCDDF